MVRTSAGREAVTGRYRFGRLNQQQPTDVEELIGPNVSPTPATSKAINAILTQLALLMSLVFAAAALATPPTQPSRPLTLLQQALRTFSESPAYHEAVQYQEVLSEKADAYRQLDLDAQLSGVISEAAFSRSAEGNALSAALLAADPKLKQHHVKPGPDMPAGRLWSQDRIELAARCYALSTDLKPMLSSPLSYDEGERAAALLRALALTSPSAVARADAAAAFTSASSNGNPHCDPKQQEMLYRAVVDAVGNPDMPAADRIIFAILPGGLLSLVSQPNNQLSMEVGAPTSRVAWEAAVAQVKQIGKSLPEDVQPVTEAQIATLKPYAEKYFDHQPPLETIERRRVQVQTACETLAGALQADDATAFDALQPTRQPEHLKAVDLRSVLLEGQPKLKILGLAWCVPLAGFNDNAEAYAVLNVIDPNGAEQRMIRMSFRWQFRFEQDVLRFDPSWVKAAATRANQEVR